MKKVIIILLAIIVSSCGVTELKMYQRQYSLKNESGQIVKLKFYNQFNSELVYTSDISIVDNDVFNGDLVEFSQPISVDENYYVNTTYRGSDSIVIIFNNARKSVYTINVNGSYSTPINRNIFRHGNYESLGNDEFQFTFTSEDYENAEDCGENCN